MSIDISIHKRSKRDSKGRIIRSARSDKNAKYRYVNSPNRGYLDIRTLDIHSIDGER